ncbi:MAG: hypothetical protein HY758_03400 [Nitrospirae bacterium]|nr:hypothetical protein [Nitrospirota bacterium]
MTKKSKDKIQEIIEASGNNFHSNVVSFLRGKEWNVLISPYYNDNATDKAREIDIIAEKPFEVKDSLWGRTKGWLNVRFIIECKYINAETVFWFDAKDKKKAEERVIRDTPLTNNNIYTQKHHYMSDERVVKLFTSEKNKDFSNEPIYKAINQSLNAMIYFRDETPIQREDRGILKTICYPIIILNDFKKIFGVNIGESNYSGVTNKYFQLEINYAYLDSNKRNMNEYFLIDVVDFSYLSGFLSEIMTKDIEAIKVML